MAFWSSEALVHHIETKGGIVTPFEPSLVKHGAYQLRLGHEVYLTSDVPQSKRLLEVGQQIVVPPGQFALLMTLERVEVPPETIAFISIRASYKLRGLINVSGFHVDPGFHGRLKFGVYNAGPRDLVLSQGAPVFSIWFASLDRATTDRYDGHWQSQDSLSDEDVMKLQGRVSSPAELRQEIDQMRSTIDGLRQRMNLLLGIAASVGAIVVGSLVVALIRWIWLPLPSPPSGVG